MKDHNYKIMDSKIVISGISGRFPHSKNVNEFQTNLLQSIDCTTVDHKLWDYDSPKIPMRIGKCSDYNKFDNIFFGIHDKLCNVMDPSLRILLEHSFEAIMDAGINPRSLKGQKVGVFVATNISEVEHLVYNHQRISSTIVGYSKAMIPNRISFFLGLIGHSIHIDTACISSASALEFAYRYMKEGICDAAIVGGSMMTLYPHLSFHFKMIGFFSTDGLTKSFDDNTEGCTRSESGSVLFLQKACDAKRIYQEIVNIQSLHVHSTEDKSIFYPTIKSQIKVMTDVLNKSKLSPNDISFLEASGVGIKKADTDELKAIDAVYTNRNEPLLVGSVKSNIGNTMPVSSINSIIKIIIASETGKIPPNINFKIPNCDAKCLKEGRIRICTDLTSWTGKYSSVNTTSIAGGFANIILKSPNIEKKNNGIPDDDLLRLIIISGRTEEAVKAILEYMENRPVDVELLQLLYDIHSSEINGHLYRGYSIVPAKGLLPPHSSKQEIILSSEKRRQVWWIFSGMGSQWVGMGEALLKLPVFEAAIQKCDTVLKSKGYDIFKIITDKDPKLFDDIVHSFIGIAAIQIGLVDTLKAVGIEPDYIIGHSVGELGCAYSDGCFTAEQMILSALSRGLASIETNLERGSMAAIGLGYSEIQSLCPPDIDVACHNGPDSSTISGPAASMKTFVASLIDKGIFAKEIPCSNIAYHSRYIAAAGSKLLRYLQRVIPKPNLRSSKWLSTSIPREEWNTIKARYSSAEYHTNNLLSSVLFDEISRHIPSNAICIEIAPHGLLQAILKRSLSTNCVNVTLTKRGHPDNLEVLLMALGKLFNAGLHPQIQNLYPKIQYPVGRGTPSISSLIKWEHTTEWNLIKEAENIPKLIEINLNEKNSEFYQENFNVINGQLLVPLSLCLVNAINIFKSFDRTNRALRVVCEKIKVHKMFTTISENNNVIFTVMVSKATGHFEVTESDILVISGTIQETTVSIQPKFNNYKSKYFSEENYAISKDDFYTEMEIRGFKYSEKFKNILRVSSKKTSALIGWNNDWVTFIDNVLQLYAFGSDLRQMQLPLSIDKFFIDHEKQENSVKNSKGVITVIDTKLNCLSAGGLKIEGLKFAIIAKNVEKYRFSSDCLNIVPNIDKSNLSLDIILRIILQLVIENTFSKMVRKIQLISDDYLQNIKTLKTIMKDIPEASVFKIEEIKYEEATFQNTLTIIINNLRTYDINELSHKLKSDKFLLIFIPNDEEDAYIKSADYAGLKVVLIRKFRKEILLLLRKKRFIDNIHMLNVSKNINATIGKINNINILSNSERMIVIIKSKDKVNINEFINKIELMDLEKIRIFLIDDPNIPDNLFVNQLLKKQLEMDLFLNILKPNKIWATLRRTKITLKPRLCKNWMANQVNSYYSTNITWTESPVLKNSGNVIKVEYSTLNYQDILITNDSFYTNSSEISGKNRLIQRTIGLEFSGIDSKGNRVMGITNGNSMSNFVNADPDFVWTIPMFWSFEDAVTVPLSYIVAYSCLFEKAQIKIGETIMLCNSTPGFGLAIILLAVQQKCDIFITYKTEAEKNLIHSICPNISENRLFKLSNHHFIDNVLLETEGQGVDVVICNQYEIKTPKIFFTVTKPQARVVLISDFDNDKIHENIGMETFLKETIFYSLVPKQILLSNSERKKFLVNMVKHGINTGCVRPLPKTTYDRNSLNEAFNTCILNKHLKKIVIKVQSDGSTQNEATAIPRLYCAKNKSYLIIDGLMIFGLELIDWLITRGAKHFVVVSSLAKENSYMNFRLNVWKSYGIQIILHTKLDLSQLQNIKTLFKEALSLGPIDAIFDLQRMNTILTKTSSMFDSINLITTFFDVESRLLSTELRFFIVFSLIQNPGNLMTIKKLDQFHSYHKSQDQIVKKILDKRKQDSLHGQMIKWGLIDSIKKNANIEAMNIIVPTITKYLQQLDDILGSEETVVEVSYVISPTNKIEENSEKIKNTPRLDSVEAEAQDFIEQLRESRNIRAYL